MTEYIRHGKRVKVERYARSFVWRDTEGAGFNFDCNKEGNPLSLEKAARDNFQACITGKYTVIDEGVIDVSYSYWEPAIIKCQCGRPLSLNASFTNSCACGREYNGGGQLLAGL